MLTAMQALPFALGWNSRYKAQILSRFDLVFAADTAHCAELETSIIYWAPPIATSAAGPSWRERAKPNLGVIDTSKDKLYYG